MNLTCAVCIPTYNAGKMWADVLKSVNDQNFKNFKKIIVDSGSGDDTVTLAQDYGFEVNQIDKSEFNHGATRQLLVNLTVNADICIFITQDAILASANSIQNIMDSFRDPKVGMAYGRQLPHKNAKVLETHARLFNYLDKPQVCTYDDKNLLGFKVFFCSNSFAAYRKISLEAVNGFPSDSIMGEDAIVAAKMLKAGYKKAYVPSATVYHSHSYTLIEEYKRYFDTRVFHEQNKWLIADYGKPTGEGIKFAKSELKYVLKHAPYNSLKSIASLFSKWLGYKSAGYYKRIPKKILKKLSMHANYWK